MGNPTSTDSADCDMAVLDYITEVIVWKLAVAGKFNGPGSFGDSAVKRDAECCVVENDPVLRRLGLENCGCASDTKMRLLIHGTSTPTD